MREIVHVQAGQCGNQIGAKFWEVRYVTSYCISRSSGCCHCCSTVVEHFARKDFF